jgi:glycosyltransferase involved in cell wall biosynthesis
MKILLTIHHFLEPNAGAPGATLQLGEAYRRLGHEVYFYSYDNLPPQLPEKLIGLLFPVYVAHQIQRLHRQNGLDVVHASSTDTWLWGSYIKWLNPRKRPILATQSHGLEHTRHAQIIEESKNGTLQLSWKYPLYKGGLLLWQATVSFQTADFCFMLNQHDAKTLIHLLQGNTNQVKVFPLPPISTALPHIAWVGSYIDRKGIQYGIPALKQLMQQHPRLRVSFLGTGCAPERVLSDFPTNVHDRIRIIPQFNKAKLPQLLENCQILLLPSLSEGFPLALIEAMACGLVPVASDIPGNTEVVNDHQNGLLVPPRNQSAIEQAITALIHDPQMLNQLRQQAYQSVQQYSWDAIAQQHLQLYQNARASSPTHKTLTPAIH